MPLREDTVGPSSRGEGEEWDNLDLSDLESNDIDVQEQIQQEETEI